MAAAHLILARGLLDRAFDARLNPEVVVVRMIDHDVKVGHLLPLILLAARLCAL